MKNILFVILILSFITVKATDSDYEPKTAVRGSFMGALFSPGFKVGVEMPYKYKKIEKIRKEITKVHYKERYLAISLSMYNQQNFHTNYIFQLDWQLRKQRSRGFFFDFGPCIGFSRTLLDGSAYTVDDVGNVIKVDYAGDFYGLAGASISLGYNFNMRSQRPIKMFLKPSLLVLFPYSNLIYPRPTIELGLMYNLR